MGADSFKKTTGNILRELRNSQKAPGQDRIFTAGEKEHDVWLYRKDRGLPVNEAVQKELIAVRDELGLTQYKFRLKHKRTFFFRSSVQEWQQITEQPGTVHLWYASGLSVRPRGEDAKFTNV